MSFITSRIAYLLLSGIIYLGFTIHAAQAQGAREPLFFSGFVVDANSSNPVPGVHIYIPKAGRGTSTNAEGFFAMPTYPNDSLIISSIGYKKHYYVVPNEKLESYSVVIELVEDTTNLPVIEVFPYPTEELFKEAFLALELPDEEQLRLLQQNLNQEIITRLALDLPMDARMNYRNQVYQNALRLENRTSIPTLQLLNPFAWARFVESIRNGDFKRDRWKKR
ncbi:MAG: hypothetical protein OHK0053_14640 [Microscillaceae bacterium]